MRRNIRTAWIAGVVVFTIMARAQDNQDSLRAVVDRGDFARAQAIIDSLELAEKTSGPLFQYFRGLFHDKVDTSEILFSGLCFDTAGPDSIRSLACARLGDIAFMRSELDSALKYYQKARELFSDSIYALMAERVRKALARDADFGAVMVDDSPDAVVYTLQVGSFGTKENAQKRLKDLAGDFKDAYIQQAEVKGTTYFRVRIGSFASKEEAMEYAEQKLRPQGINFSVLRK